MTRWLLWACSLGWACAALVLGTALGVMAVGGGIEALSHTGQTLLVVSYWSAVAGLTGWISYGLWPITGRLVRWLRVRLGGER